MMQLLSSLDEADWIEKGLSPANPWVADGTWKGSPVSRFVPPIFSAYAKLFHPIYEDLSVFDRQISWDRLESAEPGDLSPMHEIVAKHSTLVYGGPETSAPLHPISWRELAERYGLHYTPTLNVSSFSRRFPGGSWPRYLIGPREGHLEDRTRDALADILATEDNSAECFFYFWTLATTNWEGSLLYRGSLLNIAAFSAMTDQVNSTPTYWFPPDHAWLVSSDYDSPFTLIGGSESLIDRLIGSDVLECVRVAPDMRMDSGGDTPNMRKN